MKNSSEELRLRHVYRNLVLLGRVRISLEAARKLVGPDCAYHCYARIPLMRKKGSRP